MTQPGQLGSEEHLGGAINEKDKAEVYDTSLAYMLHSVFGLDHYPQYLVRWSCSKIETLESRLEGLLHEVKQQRALKVQRSEAAAKFHALHPLPPMPLHEVFDEQALMALPPAVLGGSAAMNPQAPRGHEVERVPLKQWLEEVHDGIWAVRLLQPAFCQRVIEAARAFYDFGQGVPCLAVRDRPIDLELLGMGWLADTLLRIVIFFAEAVYPHEAEGVLDWRHAFIVGYAKEKGPAITRSQLISHTDDSEVTLNCCLGEEFRGGEVLFGGVRGTREENQLVCDYKPRAGWAVLHVGRQLHSVAPVYQGRRYGLILWSRSLSGRRRKECPCCYMNGRQGPGGRASTDCVCGPLWN